MKDQKSEPDYLTAGEVARLLRVSSRTVDRWANDGRLACLMTLGGHRRFSRDDVAAVVEKMTRPAVAR